MRRVNRKYRSILHLPVALIATLPHAAVAQDVLIRGAKVHTVDAGGTLAQADVLVRGGRVVEIGNAVGAPGIPVIEAHGRPLTPGLFGGITGLGIHEISQEPSTVDDSPAASEAEDPFAVARPEFDVAIAFNPDSAAIGVNRVEGVTFAMIAPSASTGGTVLAGQGAIARLDGRVEAMIPASRTLFVDLGADTSSSGISRAGQFMLLEIGRAHV